MFTKSSLHLNFLTLSGIFLVLIEPSVSFVWTTTPAVSPLASVTSHHHHYKQQQQQQQHHHHHQQQQQQQQQRRQLSSSRHFVYTPEQEGDEKNVGDQVLEDLVKKLDKSSSSSSKSTKKKDNKAMAFLKKIGKVGGAANKDFGTATGSDEGAGMSPMSSSPSTTTTSSSVRKSQQAFVEATESGIIDDMTENFPMTSSGTEWRGVSDRVRGGTSEGFIKREVIDGRTANVLIGKVTGSGGFIQMITELSKDYSTKDSVDATDFDGIEIDVLSKEDLEFNIHLRVRGSLQKASYRHTVQLECLFAWQTIRVPFSSFLVQEEGNGERKSVNYSKLKRIGIVALDKETDVYLAIGGVRFYNVI